MSDLQINVLNVFCAYNNPINYGVDMKRFDSISARFLLILITPTILSQFVFSYIFLGRYIESTTKCISNMVVGEIVALKNALDNNEQNINKIAQSMNMDVVILKNTCVKNIKTKYNARVQKTLYRAFVKHNIFDVFIKPVRKMMCVYINAQNNAVYKFTFCKKQIYGNITSVAIIWSAISTIILLFIAFIFLKNQIRPIKKLAIAIRDFGDGIDSNEYTPSGAKEILLAGNAFCEMKTNFRKLLTKRINTLAGISHDLKTPLTRMKLQLALMKKNKETDGLSNDVNAMIELTESFMEYSREQNFETFTCFNLYNFLQTAITGTSFQICIDGDRSILVYAKKTMLLRACNNIISNAQKYATQMYISFYKEDNFIVICFEDNGPGIEKNIIADIFEPFVTNDINTTNRTKSSGLGLSIVHDIITDHGGSITAENSKNYSGAKFTVKLPSCKNNQQ